MPDSVTIGQIAVAITFIVGLITGVSYIRNHLESWISRAMSPQTDRLSRQIEKLSDEIKQVDLEGCKNFLVTVLADLERGVEIDEIQRARFWEQYQHYEKSGGNSYIKRKVEQMKKDGNL